MQMRKAIVAGGLVVMLAGCGSTGGFLNRARPNEFAVTRAAPLVVPPDFNLTPPAPGTPRAQEADSSQQALQAMFGGPAPRSDAEERRHLPQRARHGHRRASGQTSVIPAPMWQTRVP